MSEFKLMARRIWPYVLLFLCAQFLIRLTLAIYSHAALTTNADWLVPFATGFLFDIAVALMVLPVLMVFPTLLPKSWAGGRLDRSVAFGAFAVLAFLMIFQGISEYFFWDEFTTRFNFIAVDYLIYTQEVLANILESYPVFPLLALAATSALALAWLARKPLFSGLNTLPGLGGRLAAFAVFCALGAGAYAVTGKGLVDRISNPAAQELGSNGLYNFVYAYFYNEIEYRKFYPTIADDQAIATVRAQYAGDGSILEPAEEGVIEREFVRTGLPLRKNVIQITMESMGADFMAAFGNKDGLTPNLDRLSGEGLFLANMRATGTRTVRGLEALTLSVPPTPGQSIVRRPGNENLYSLGAVLQDQGYETKFIYGGNGYFDNMNEFFASNGYTVRDQGDMKPEDIRFSNAWGVSDIDLFNFAIKEADSSYAAGKPFFNMVLTTSNHRPFTYPDGEIDIPSPGGRNGAVKFSDHAVGKLIEAASAKPWFKDTVFIFVGDHTDSVAGKQELDFGKFQVPCIFWSPGMIAPERIDRLTSQIDVAPTLLGLLNISYDSRFYGVDVRTPKADSMVFVSNYEKVALVRDDLITVLEPVNQVHQYKDGVRLEAGKLDLARRDEAIAIYQVASDWREASKRIETRLGKDNPKVD